MSFQYVPGLLRTPAIPMVSLPRGVWRGKGADEGYYAFSAGSSWGSFVMVRGTGFVPSLIAGGNRLTPVFSDVNGYIHWSGSGYIYYSQTYGWVWCRMFPGYEPVEEKVTDPSTGKAEWTGDEFYVIQSFPYGDDSETRMTPRGSAREKDPQPLKASWERWACNQEFGVYEGKGGASGKRVLGTPQFSGNGEKFLRSVNRTNGYYTYGRIHNSNGRWVIGEIGSSTGWHEGAEPKADGGSVSFRFCRPEGSDVTGRDISVSFERYVEGEESDTAYLGEVAVWR